MVWDVPAQLSFMVALIISMVMIYSAARWFGAVDRLTTAVLAVFVGSAVCTIFYCVSGQDLLPAFTVGIAMAPGMQKLYTIGWFRALIITVFIWIVSSVAG